jgi:hypothetical protein
VVEDEELQMMMMMVVMRGKVRSPNLFCLYFGAQARQDKAQPNPNCT